MLRLVTQKPVMINKKFFSARMSSGEECADDRGRGAWAVPQIKGDLSTATHSAGA